MAVIVDDGGGGAVSLASAFDLFPCDDAFLSLEVDACRISFPPPSSDIDPALDTAILLGAFEGGAAGAFFGVPDMGPS